MTLPNHVKTCLLVTYGPVPTPQYQTIEGGGMRVWGLAKGLQAHGVTTTVAINQSFPQEITEQEGIKLVNWSLDDQFAALINTYDAVVVSYTMGDPSVFIVDHINDNVQLILDVYVPIYVEVSARDAVDMTTEMRNYMADLKRYNHVLKRGDYFLCASKAQKTFYVGVLAALGVINPRSYRNDRIIIAPLGIHDLAPTTTENPYLKLGIKESDFTVMWFGGLYPWFRVEELLNAILTLSKYKDFKFVVVGGKNPFNPNPDFTKQYDKTRAFAEKHNLTDKSLFFVDWVDYEKRINWFKHADVVVSLNQPGEENSFAWRTRVMDFVWGELAIVTNGGDPLSEDLIAHDAAVRIPELSTAALTDTLQNLHKDREQLQHIRDAVIALQPKYHWQNICKPVADIIFAGERPYDDERQFKHKADISTTESVTEVSIALPAGTLHKVKKIIKLPKKVLSYARRKGLKRSAKAAFAIAKNQFSSHVSTREKRFIFISHPINNTGAPLVLLRIIEEYAKKYGGKNIQLVTPHIEPHYARPLHEMGVTIDKAAMEIGLRTISLQLNLQKNDVVLMNTVAIYDNYRDYILHALGSGRLDHAYWFIHEDKDQLPVINASFFDKARLDRIHDLMEEGKLTIMTPSERTRQDYNKIFASDRVAVVPLAVTVPQKYMTPRQVNDYHNMRFLISGTPSDGRKGQLIAIAAFYDFMQRYYVKDPSTYRDFTLELLAIGNDYISQQVRWMGESLLGKHIAIHDSLPQPEAMALYSKCNGVICCSLNETFALYVAEGMLMGHVILRNNSAGVDEQLQEGKNGYLIDHTDVPAFADVIEKVLSRKKTSDEQLQKMGETSQKIAKSFSENTYLQQIEKLK